MLINKPELHLAFHVPSLQAYNSVSLVSLLACLSQLVYSLDVWPSAEWDTHAHTRIHTVTHTCRWFKSDLSVREAEHSRSGGLYSAMNLNYGKHPHLQCLCRRASCQWYTCILKDSATVSNEGGLPAVSHANSNTENEKTQRESEEKAWEGAKGWCWKCLWLHGMLRDRCRHLERERNKGGERMGGRGGGRRE